jgi:Mg-chelatase subunit ChlD
MRSVSVINKVTQEPVPLATLTFIHNHNTAKPAKIKMDREGKAVEEFPIGQYNITGNIEGYEPYANEIFVPKTMPAILIELTPKNRPSPVISEQQPEVVQNNPSAPILSADLPEDKFAANNIILLLDVSTSMKAQKKFSLLQQSINNLVLILRPIDHVSIITYASDAKVVMPSTSGDRKEKITGVVQDLVPSGTTQGVKGLNMAYETALKQYIQGGNNQIILATDGEFSEKGLTDAYYEKFITGYAQKGIKLSILGFGVNQSAIDRMKKMTGYGNGSYIHIDSEKFAKDVLIEEIRNKSMMD